MKHNGSGRAAGIRREIDETRCRMDRTIDELQMRLSPRYIADQAVCALKEKARDVRQSMFNTIKDHPIPSALMGAGAACLAACIVRDRMNRKPTASDARIRRDNAMYQAGYARNSGAGMTPASQRFEGGSAYGGETSYEGDACEYGASSAESSRGRVRERIGHVTESIRESADDLRHRVADRASALGHRVGDTASNVRHRVSDTAHTVARRTKEGARYASHKARETYDEHPIMLGLAAVGLGIAAGLSIPASRRENRWFGESRDQLLRKAREVGEDTLERGKEVAKSVAHCATDEAKHQLGASSTGASSAQSKSSGGTSLQGSSSSGQSGASKASTGSRDGERAGRAMESNRSEGGSAASSRSNQATRTGTESSCPSGVGTGSSGRSST